MAGRPMGRRHQDDVRAKIQVSQLLNVLHKQALEDDAAEISNIRLKAIEILLKKSLPDMTAVTISGDEDNPLTMISKVQREIIDPSN